MERAKPYAHKKSGIRGNWNLWVRSEWFACHVYTLTKIVWLARSCGRLCRWEKIELSRFVFTDLTVRRSPLGRESTRRLSYPFSYSRSFVDFSSSQYKRFIKCGLKVSVLRGQDGKFDILTHLGDLFLFDHQPSSGSHTSGHAKLPWLCGCAPIHFFVPDFERTIWHHGSVMAILGRQIDSHNSGDE